MSYVMGESAHPRRSRRWPWVLVAVVVLAAVVVAGFVLGRGTNSTPPQAGAPPREEAASPAPAPPPQDPGSLGPVSWQPLAHGEQVPHSSEHGPRVVEGALATGYTHNEGGAVMAAINLSARLSPAADPNTAIRVLAEQAVGDRAEQARMLGRETTSSASPEETRPSRWWWAITGGSAAGERAEVSLVAETAESRQMGGYVRVQRTLVWHEGDWALQVPVTGPQVVPTVPADHHLLEGPG